MSDDIEYKCVILVITYIDIVYKINLHSTISDYNTTDCTLYYDPYEYINILEFLNNLKNNIYAIYECFSLNGADRENDNSLTIKVKKRYIYIYDESKYCTIRLPIELKDDLIKYLMIIYKF